MIKHKIVIIALICIGFVFNNLLQNQLPDGFVYVKEIIPDLDVELRYFSTHNFVGDTIEGYNANTLIVTIQTAEALKKVQDELQHYNLCLKVYDGYRPQRAVNHFISWTKALNDTINKQEFYPIVEKQHLFRDGYIASKSGHSRGSTLDLTIIDGNTSEPLDMGSPYDFFGVQCHFTDVGTSRQPSGFCRGGAKKPRDIGADARKQQCTYAYSLERRGALNQG